MKAVFAGCARDCASALPRVLEKIDAIAAHFREIAYVFVENGSRDATRAHLQRFGAGRPRFILPHVDHIGELPRRGQRLEAARNLIVETLRTTPALRDFDFLVLLDLDDANAQPQPIEGFERALAWLGEDGNRAAGFANQRGLYYDLWALRHPRLCPGDVWEEVFDYARTHRVSDQQAFDATFEKRLFWVPVEDPPLEVDSAFGGLGVYRMPFVINNRNPYLGVKTKTLDDSTVVHWEQCEHVHFHAGIRAQGGRLCILPWLVNARNEGIRFNPSAFRQLVFQLP